MKRRHKVYIRLNLMSIVFVVVSFISVTLAWFAYSGLSTANMEIGVKVWNIELEKDNKPISNNILVSLSDIYPGMETVSELVNIKNLGDSDAQLHYSIVSARILGDNEHNYVIDDENVTSEYVEDRLSHYYPFHININIDKNYISAEDGVSEFEVSVSWPLDSGDDSWDSIWGKQAYDFKNNEDELKKEDANYQVRPSIQVVISVMAEQYIESDTSSDMRFNLGDSIKYDVVNNNKCIELNSNCINTYVIDINNKVGDEKVTLLPDPSGNYSNGSYNDYDLENPNSALSTMISNWTVPVRKLTTEEILKIVSKDITNSLLVRNNVSNVVIGNLNYDNRFSQEISKAIDSDAFGHYIYLKDKFSYLNSSNCYWTDSQYDINNGFAVSEVDANNSKIGARNKSNSCKLIPVISVDKQKLQ